MTTSAELRAFFRPYVRATYPAATGGPSAAPADAAGRDALFVSLAGLRAWAEAAGLSLRAAMIRLLAENIWPERFRRNFGLLSAADLARLLQCRALVLGCGGLGGHVAELLARCGVGRIRLVDDDVFDESNLNRQRFCSERTLGRAKAQATRDALADIASHVEAEALRVAADERNLADLVAGMDLALDCLDSIPAKTALEQAALAAGVPFVHGSVLRDEGFCYVNSGPAARLKELYPSGAGQQETARGRREGISALAPASVACLMVRLGLNAVLGRGPDSPLLHLDLSVPELERFSWSDGA